jgi:hypothetical protein
MIRVFPRFFLKAMKEDGEPVDKVNDVCYKVVDLCKEPLNVSRLSILVMD